MYDTTRARAATSVPLASSLDSDASAAENAEPPAELLINTINQQIEVN